MTDNEDILLFREQIKGAKKLKQDTIITPRPNLKKKA